MADLIVFNRCTDELKQMLYKKNIRAMNPRATIFLDDVNGGSEDYRDNMPRPFDLDAPVIDISDENFGLWYVDATGDPEPYIGKTVKFKGMVYKTKKMEQEHVFVPGRFAMVCCADDVQFVGFLCKDADTTGIAHKSWVTVTAEVRVEYVPQYRGRGARCCIVRRSRKPKRRRKNSIFQLSTAPINRGPGDEFPGAIQPRRLAARRSERNPPFETRCPTRVSTQTNKKERPSCRTVFLMSALCARSIAHPTPFIRAQRGNKDSDLRALGCAFLFFFR